MAGGLFAPVAQLAELPPFKRNVEGSSPFRGTRRKETKMDNQWSESQIQQAIQNLRECSRVNTACRFCAGDPTLCQQDFFQLMRDSASMLEQLIKQE